MRPDGRKHDQLRLVHIEKKCLAFAEGSCLISMGQTKVLCAASVEQKVPPFLHGTGQGWVTAEYGLLPRSTHTRTTRDASRGRPDGRTYEIQRLIGRSLRCVVDLPSLGERTIWIDCDVIQADGGTRCAAITGAFVALHDAVSKLADEGTILTWPIKDFIAAVSVGIVKDKETLDLSYGEDSHAEVDMNVVMTLTGKIVEIQAAAERRPFSEEEMKNLMELAKSGISVLIEKQKQVLK